MAIGVQSASVPFLGGNLLLSPLVTAAIPIPASGLPLSTFVPVDPSLTSAPFYMQTGVFDTGAPQGVALSRGLRMTIEFRD